MYYVIQENLFREHHFSTLTGYLFRNNLDYEIVRYRPFLEDIPVQTDRKDVWFFGSINAGKVFKKRDWNPGIIYNENFDFDVYLKKYGRELLNYDAKIQSFGHIPFMDRRELFIRPTHDTKTFESNLYTESQWDSYVLEAVESKTAELIDAETKVMYACPKHDIQQEIRCWVVDGKFVTASQYRIGRRIAMLNMDHNEEARIFVKDMCKIYMPAKAFVMDICLYEDEYKIVELGCINHCGFYDADMSKLIQALENTFGTKNL